MTSQRRSPIGWGRRLIGRFEPRWPLDALFDWIETRINTLQVVEATVSVPPRLKLGPPLRAVFVSDLHLGPTTGPRAVRRATMAVEAARPDLILLGGDYVLSDAKHAARLGPVLRSWRAPLGSYAVWGNHDLAADTARIAAIVEAAGVRLLRNSSVRLAAPYQWLRLVGLDDLLQGEPDVQAAFGDDHAAGDVVLLLTHHPDAVELLGQRTADLILAGHTHGGGVCLPGGTPLLRPSQRGYIAGRYQTRWGPLVVSRGIGCSELPLRPFNPPDIVLIDIG